MDTKDYELIIFSSGIGSATLKPSCLSGAVRDCRAAAAGGPPGVLPEVRAPRGQRGRPSQAQVRAHAAADHGRGEAGQVCVILLIFTMINLS